MDVSLAGRGDDLLVWDGTALVAVCNVLTDSRVKQHGLLSHDAYLGPQPGDVHVRCVVPVNKLQRDRHFDLVWRHLDMVYVTKGFFDSVVHNWVIKGRGVSQSAVTDPGGDPGDWTPPPLFGPRCRLFIIGPKPGPPHPFACRPKLDPPFKNPASIIVGI